MQAKSVVCLGSVLGLLVAGCAWQRIDAPPAYKAETIPITIGLNPGQGPQASGIAPDLARELKTIGGFKEVIYPYRSSDAVDCVLEFDTVRTVEGHAVGAGVASGLTLGLAGTVVGPSMVARDNFDFYLTNGKTQIAHEKVNVESQSEFGVFANATDVAAKHSALHNRKLAIAIAEKLKTHRSAIEETCRGFSRQASN